MTSSVQTLWHQAAQTWSATGASAGTAGVEITVSRPGILAGLWLYSPASESLTSAPASIALYAVSGTTLLTSNTATWSAGYGTGWIYARLTTPQWLAPGTSYMAAVFGAAASFGYDSSFTWPAASGPLTGVNGGYYSTSGSLAYPSSQQSGWNWWIDPLVICGDQPPQVARGRQLLRRSRSASSPGSPLVPPNALLTEAGGRQLNEAGGSILAESWPPSPFALPGKAARGRAAAARSRSASSRGAPVTPPPPPSPFTLPAKPARGHGAARKSRPASSPGAPLVPPPVAPFSPPGRPQRGKPAARRSRSASSPGSPVVPAQASPFALPWRPARGRGAAARSRSAASPGAPATFPAPFTLPGRAKQGKSAARRSRSASSAGAPVIPVLPSPFALPGHAERGKPAVRTSRAQHSPGSPLTLPPPAPFTLPGRPARGKPAARKAAFRSSPGAPATRSQFTWPFTWDSIWNLPISAGAEYASTGITVNSDYSTDSTAVEYNCTDPTQPVKVLDGALNADGDTVNVNVYVPPGMTGAGEWNDAAAFLGTDEDSVYQGESLELTAGGNPSFGGATDSPFPAVSITGTGYYGAHGGSNLSTLGGTLTKADLTGSVPIAHAMKVCFNGGIYYSSEGSGYTWPATTADTGYSDPDSPNFYGGGNPYIVEGALLALPPSISPSKYSDPLVQKIATAMQCYGAYIVDNTGSGAGVSDSIVELNYDAVSYFTGTGTFSSDFHQLLMDLQVITNNTASTPGGGPVGSDRYAPYAPPSADGKLAAPPPVTVVAPGAGTPSPFSLPGRPARGRTTGRRSRSARSAGSPVTVPAVPSRFTAPRPPRRKGVAGKSRTASSPGSPPIPPGVLLTEAGGRLLNEAGGSFSVESWPPSPFTLPSRAARGRMAAARSRSSASPGAPAVLAPPGIPSPFTLPARAAKGRQAAVRSRAASSPGAPAVLSAPSPSPFALPLKAARGTAAARRSRTAWSAGAPVSVSAGGGNALLGENGSPLLGEAGNDLLDESTGAGGGSGYGILGEDGNLLLDEAGSSILEESGGAGGGPGGGGTGSGYSILGEAGGALLDEAGNSLLEESAGTSGGTGGTGGGGSGPPGTFPDVPLDVRAELLLGGGWTDVTAWMDQGPVTISRGHPDESTTVSPSTLAMTLTNANAEFSPDNVMSPFWPDLVQNTPVRVSIPAQQPYLRLEANEQDRAYVSDTGAVDLTGSMEMRIELRLSDWRGCCLAHKWDGGASWAWLLLPGGYLFFGWITSGGANYWTATSTAPLANVSGATALRVTMNAENGAVTFSVSDQIDGAYAQLGDVLYPTGGTSTTVQAAHGSALTVGYSFNFSATEQLLGNVYEYRLYSGIGGTLVADAQFSAVTPGADSWTDTQGNGWQLAGGAEVSARNYRGHFEAPEWPQDEPGYDPNDPGGDDGIPVDALVQVQGGGLLRRYSQRNNPTQSALYRAISLQPGQLAPAAYWSMEDLAGASSFGSATGGLPMTINGSPTLATDSSFVASNPLPTLGGAVLCGQVPAYSSNGSLIVRFPAKVGSSLPALPTASYATLARISTSGTVRSLYVVVYDDGGLGLIGYSAAGATIVNTGDVLFGTGATPALRTASGQAWLYSVEITPVSGGIQCALVTVAPGATTGEEITATVSGGLVGNAAEITVNPNGFFTDTVIGHLQVQSEWSSLFTLGPALNGWLDEPAGTRFARLCAEEGVQCRTRGNLADTTAMGVQTPQTLAQLLQACADADLAVWTELRQALGWGFVTRKALYNQPAAVAVDYNQDHLSPWKSAPTRDDQTIVNDVTYTNASGSSVRVFAAPGQPIAGGRMSTLAPGSGGVGTYDQQYQVAIGNDSDLQNLAGWKLHLGTSDQARLPGIQLDLTGRGLASMFYDVLDMDLGDRLTIANPPARLGPDTVTQLAQDLTEELWSATLTVSVAGVPELPYEVAQVGAWHVAPARTVLGVNATETMTSLEFVNEGLPWTTDPANYPLNVKIAGEEITVLSVSGSGTYQTATVVRSVNGVVKPLPSAAPVTMWPPFVIGL